MVTESHILGQEVMLGREAHSGWEASTVVWETTLGGDHPGGSPREQPLWAKRTKPSDAHSTRGAQTAEGNDVRAPSG